METKKIIDIDFRGRKQITTILEFDFSYQQYKIPYFLNENDTLIFHIGRGGRFYNQGHVTCKGFGDLDELMKYIGNDLFISNRDANGRFVKPYYSDCNGKYVGDLDDTYFDFDGDYNTWYIKPLFKLNENEVDAAVESGDLIEIEIEEEEEE